MIAAVYASTLNCYRKGGTRRKRHNTLMDVLVMIALDIASSISEKLLLPHSCLHIEQKLQGRLAKRSLAASPEENVLKIKTGGQVSLSSTIHGNIWHYTCICPSASAKSGVSKGIQQVLASMDTSSERHSKETQCQ